VHSDNLLHEVPGARCEILPWDPAGLLGSQDSTPADAFVNKFSSWISPYMVNTGRVRFAEFCIWDFKYRRN